MAVKNLSRFQAGRLSTKDLYNSTDDKYTYAYAVGNEQFFGKVVNLPVTYTTRRRESTVISS